MRKTKIVCTIGPASEKPEVLKQLIDHGMNVVRLNFSHGSHEEHLGRINTVKAVRREMNVPVAILLDTKGPEIRTGKFKDPEVLLEQGKEYILTTRDILGDATISNISYEGLPADVVPGDRILIDDGLVELEVLEVVNDTDIRCHINNSGTIKNHKGVNVPGVKINLPAITKKDADDIIFGIQNGIDFIAASFVRKPQDVYEIRRILEEHNAADIQIISKIENQEGVDNIDDIIEVSDGIMVARGDLGVEIPTEQIPLVQKMIIKKCNAVGKPVITATQMLDSMIRNPRPTRAEVTDVANAIFDGTDAIMLSGETAAGKYPLESVKTMANIAKTTEDSLDYRSILKEKGVGKEKSITDAVSHATCTSAQDLGASAIITSTSSGFTARMVSKFRPKAPIIATTTSHRVARQLALTWNTYPIVTGEGESTDEVFDLAIKEALKHKYIKCGDLIVITAGVPVGVAGTTNTIKVQIVGEVLLKGMGIGKKAAIGKVCVVKDAKEAAEKFEEGNILVTAATDSDMVPFMEKSAAIIVEEGGLTSHAAIVGLHLGKPTIVGAADATSILKDGGTITVDSIRGLAYRGKANVL
ncbi:pyruvate kinase [Geosporobacter subterraneus DSM 17957]|uniref:Pyruvate kinase n=1 Tax=Geosporobacter subterraneus DSM 17957 TaxID=1121919 RepID=A0A1M6JD62_9FIRM|nr:pyruvate kinase [Geosporobacter subterraneus]SHJ44608.1 pyruvate kinase [Geosporobacter subterraneus DSM 17957]